MELGAKRTQTKKKGRHTLIKRLIKLLPVNPDPVQNLGLSRNPPDQVNKTICNAPYTWSHGSIQLNPNHKSLFTK